jgi:phosphatidate cytidylyltransferase
VNNIITRSLSGLIFIIVMAGALWLGQFTFMIIFTTIIVISLFEFYRLIEKLEINPQKITGILLGIIIFGLTLLNAKQWIAGEWLLSSILILFLVPLIEFFRKSESPFYNIVFTLFGIFYVAITLSFSSYLVFIKDTANQYSHQFLLFVFILIWTSDTFAYLTGKYTGKHKLSKSVSPKKSWEGLLGGIFFGIIAGLIIFYLSRSLTLSHWIIISVLVPLTGTLGDLTESVIKRAAKVKDSGNVLPGHGGLLDRFDAAIFAIPAVFVYLKIFVF